MPLSEFRSSIKSFFASATFSSGEVYPAGVCFRLFGHNDAKPKINLLANNVCHHRTESSRASENVDINAGGSRW